MGLTIGAPATEPISSAEAKLQLRITDTNSDTLIADLIIAAREYVEAFTRRSLVNRSNVWTLDELPADKMLYLPRPPAGSITSFKYYDTAGVQQTWAAANYTLDIASTPGRLYPAYNVDWPTIRDQHDAVEITYVAGYGATSAAVPEIFRTCVAMYVVDLFEHRGSQSEWRITPNDAIDSLMRMKQVPEIR